MQAKASSRKIIRVGTRESALARLQTDIVTNGLSSIQSDLEIEIVPVTTRGDRVLDRPIADLGGRGVFVKELEEALLAGEVDFVVHSLKDLPTDLPDGLMLAAVLNREDPRDVLLAHQGNEVASLPPGARVATSSRRRAAQLAALRSDLSFVDIRGNLPTRLRKFDENYCDAMVLAAAGLLRLGLKERITQFLPLEVCTPAVGQGALAVECRAGDEDIVKLLAEVNDKKVNAEISCERSFLDRLGGGCSVPIGALARLEGQHLLVTGCVAELDGKKVIRKTIEGSPADAAGLGLTLAETMLSEGAEEILAHLKASAPNTISAP